MSDQNKVIISEALRKRIYRAKLKDQLGDEVKNRGVQGCTEIKGASALVTK